MVVRLLKHRCPAPDQRSIDAGQKNLSTNQQSSSKRKSRTSGTLFLVSGICAVIYCLSSGEYYKSNRPTTSTIEDISGGSSHQQSVQQTYKHTNVNLHKRFDRCTNDQMNIINEQLKLDDKKAIWISHATKCPETSWIEEFYAEEPADLGNNDTFFLGISIGCNKGYDAINTARMGMSNADFDKKAWSDAFLDVKGSIEARGACFQARKTGRQFHVTKPARKGEMHCVEPMPSTIALLTNASSTLDLESKGFIINGAAITSTDGTIQFPNASGGTETKSIADCYKEKGKPKRSHVLLADVCGKICEEQGSNQHTSN